MAEIPRAVKIFENLRYICFYMIVAEIPLFHVLNARITFGNVCASEKEIGGVVCIKEDDQMYCTVDETCFEAPLGYNRIGK